MRQAVAHEEEALRFYERARPRMGSPEGARLMERLAQEELAHKERLEALLQEGVDEIIYEGEEELKVAVEERSALTRGGLLTEDLKILEEALTREEAQYHFYLALSQKAALPLAKRVFACLAKRERAHMERMLEVLEGKAPPIGTVAETGEKEG
ncbi:MAG: ferritin family protein [Nitrospinota bacterium]